MKLAQARRLAIGAQGYARRFRRADAADVRAALRRLSCVQLDSISTVERSHRIVLSSRVGAYKDAVTSDMLRTGKAFEYWAHEACLIPIEDYPLYKSRMADRQHHHWWGDVIGRDRALAKAVLKRIEREGPVKASDFEGRSGGMWDLKPEKKMLEALWTAGKLAVSGREGFQRVYDLPERVIPSKLLDAPAPSETETLRALCLRAVKARGVLTAAGVAEHFRIDGRTRTVQPHLDALARAGDVARAEPEDEGKPMYVDPDAKEGTASALLSPFDNLVWDRAFLRRAFGFDHVMEIYKRPHERVYGYYVLPFLHGDKLIARVDVKSERASGTLVARAVHRVEGAPWSSGADDQLTKSLERLARTAGLERVRLAPAKP
ncbi:MAG TPA: crosslink repair DNA glycosylase YcaQ family protein [Candidatus Thermoplasmatota archaeon]|nr:crosslink repair DNA glycosylase YcaQ family protein [Candidatus Thermoplasmatota archaeon]